MILGIGSDIIDIHRIETLLATQGTRFIARTFTAAEQKKAASRKQTQAATYAKRFAAKEAAAKALGSGIGKNCGLKDIEIGNTQHGAPTITLSGAAKKTLASLTPHGKKARVLLTLADDYPYALAFVMIVAEPANKR
jgi:holo-[acyl-carrier protein] synthase